MASITINLSSVKVELSAELIAQSAADNNIDFISFKATLDNFSNSSISPVSEIAAWREEAAQLYMEKLKADGRLNMKAEEFFGSSDCDDEDDPSSNNINN